MNGKKSDTFEIKVSKIEIKSANKQENATILTAITGGGMITSRICRSFIFLVLSKPAFLLQGFLSGNKS
jgi:hypothetical protein